MAYTKTNWINGQAPALSAENLNKMEEGIYNNDADISVIQSDISNINNDLIPDETNLTRDSQWTSGTITFSMIGKLVIIGIVNIRRSAATNGYIDVASLPSGITSKATCAVFAYVDNGSVIKGAALRISNDVLQCNTSSIVPSYGVTGIYIFEAN